MLLWDAARGGASQGRWLGWLGWFGWGWGWGGRTGLEGKEDGDLAGLGWTGLRFAIVWRDRGGRLEMGVRVDVLYCKYGIVRV